MSSSKNLDHFKIVAVIRKKRVEYSYVPHKWEKEGCLFWPQANLSALRTDAATEPGEDWKQYTCKVKKNYIYGLKEAELWEEQFVDEGTDAEGLTLVDLPKKKLTIKPRVREKPDSNQLKIISVYDHEFEAVDRAVDAQANPVPVCSPENNIVILDKTGAWGYPEASLEASSEDTADSGSLTNNTQSKLDEILINQEKIMKAQERMAQRMDSEFMQQKATYDKIYKMLRETHVSSTISDNLVNPDAQQTE